MTMSERLALSKQEILAFCDDVLERWGKDPARNGRNILAMNAVKASVVWTDEETLKAVWSEITDWMYQLLYENAMAQAGKEGAKWPGTMKKARRQRS